MRLTKQHFLKAKLSKMKKNGDALLNADDGIIGARLFSGRCNSS
jgi:hypothetical protein